MFRKPSGDGFSFNASCNVSNFASDRQNKTPTYRKEKDISGLSGRSAKQPGERPMTGMKGAREARDNR